MAGPVSPEKLDLIAKALDDGWPMIEIQKTYHVTNRTIQRHFPGSGWTRQQVSAQGLAVKRANKLIRIMNA